MLHIPCKLLASQSSWSAVAAYEAVCDGIHNVGMYPGPSLSTDTDARHTVQLQRHFSPQVLIITAQFCQETT